MFIGFAISGHVAKNLDGADPNAAVSEKENKKDSEKSSSSSGSVTLVAVGDNLIHMTMIDSGRSESGAEDYSPFYANIKSYISDADIAVINQETILGGSECEYSGYPTYNTPWAVGDAAINAGFDIFTCATEHAMDMGFSGIEQECLFFDEHPEVVHTGTNDSEDDWKNGVYYEKNGMTIAILNYAFGMNGVSLPDGKQWCVNILNRDKVTADVKEAQGKADVVVVFPHWGTEYSTSVSSYQQEYVKLFSELGVDIVIGSHPHVLQPVEWVENSETGKKMLVYYSLGNFLSYQTSLDQLCGGMAEIKLEKTADGIEISSAKLIPTVCWYEEKNGDFSFTVYKLSDYTDALAKSHAQSELGPTPEYFSKLVKEIVSEEFL